MQARLLTMPYMAQLLRMSLLEFSLRDLDVMYSARPAVWVYLHAMQPSGLAVAGPRKGPHAPTGFRECRQ